MQLPPTSLRRGLAIQGNKPSWNGVSPLQVMGCHSALKANSVDYILFSVSIVGINRDFVVLSCMQLPNQPNPYLVRLFKSKFKPRIILIDGNPSS